ncbi:uncharacterized protein HaLaN_14371 [Haematococcus lacustris]|uniref:Uncharacterized protein n=1 Tax=Haematococcus lacustris TaxID=44745 RepID=A0A699Z4X1_HAELA|nr:uncharacterized protein HaLaN_14371 [Haematococcus lacustris]
MHMLQAWVQQVVKAALPEVAVVCYDWKAFTLQELLRYIKKALGPGAKVTSIAVALWNLTAVPFAAADDALGGYQLSTFIEEPVSGVLSIIASTIHGIDLYFNRQEQAEPS